MNRGAAPRIWKDHVHVRQVFLRFDDDAGFFLHLARRRVERGLTPFHMATGKAPEPRVGLLDPPHQKHPVLMKDDGNGT